MNALYKILHTKKFQGKGLLWFFVGHFFHPSKITLGNNNPGSFLRDSPTGSPPVYFYNIKSLNATLHALAL